MEKNTNKGLDDKTLLLNKALGVSLVLLGVYGLVFAYKIYTKK